MSSQQANETVIETSNIPDQAPEETTPGIDRKLVWVLAVACALTAANLYYIQPLLADIARSFAVSDSAVGSIATLSQLGFALGLLLIVPLGDFFNRRNLIVAALLGVTISLLAMAFAPSILFLAIASFIVGITTVVPQVIVPLAASLAHPHERGRVVGAIMSGLLIGILLARTVSGFVGAAFGWRTMYWIAAILMLALALALRLLLPGEQRRPHVSYPELVRSLWELLRTEPVVREVAVFGGLMFGAFSVFWVTLVFFLGTPPYHYGSEVVGLFGLVGVVGAIAASTVGTLSDRMNPRIITGFMLAAVLLAFLAFWLTGYSLWGLIIGVILLDLGVQGTHISNQARIYALNPAARSRLNTLYMFFYFIGGSLGSILGAYSWGIAHWNGVCFVGILMVVVALSVYAVGSRRGAFSFKK
ncbi:MAG TPA: MFS transporter [Ktedonobacteraceae bacterium]|nr:MFS transporter [Ktedonobacteraceae bacterium]